MVKNILISLSKHFPAAQILLQAIIQKRKVESFEPVNDGDSHEKKQKPGT